MKKDPVKKCVETWSYAVKCEVLHVREVLE